MAGPRRKEYAARLLLVLLGLGMALALLEIGMRGAGEVLLAIRRQRVGHAPLNPDEIRILCLGESTTDGTDADGRYPEMLEEILNAQGLDRRVVVVNRGRSGATTADILHHLRRDLTQFSPHLVVTMMGINDAGRTHAYGSVIAPGVNRWYGSFRIYKLYRLIRDTVDRGFEPPPRENPQLLVDHLGAPSAAPPSLQTAEALRSAKELVDVRNFPAAIDALELLRLGQPAAEQVYAQLADAYIEADMPAAAHAILEEAVATLPQPGASLVAALARSYDERGDREKAVLWMREVIDSIVDPTNVIEQAHYRLALAGMYEVDGQLDRAEETLRGIIELEAANDVAYQPLIEFLDRHDRGADALRYRDLQERIRNELVNPRTRRSYGSLRDHLEIRGIPLIAAQYPMRRVEVLRRELDDDERVTYVDNGFFRKLVEHEGYWEYFTDRFAGDFGHLTEKGNRLLAENIARAITEKHFGLPFRPVATPNPTPGSGGARS